MFNVGGFISLANNEADKFVFKVASLRNVAKTGPCHPIKKVRCVIRV